MASHHLKVAQQTLEPISQIAINSEKGGLDTGWKPIIAIGRCRERRFCPETTKRAPKSALHKRCTVFIPHYNGYSVRYLNAGYLKGP